MFHEILLQNNVKYYKLFIFVLLKYCEILYNMKILVLSGQYFRDFTIFHNISHVSQYCTLYCAAPLCFDDVLLSLWCR